jgi:hypothetical protein
LPWKLYYIISVKSFGRRYARRETRMAEILNVSDLVVHLHSNIDAVHSAIQSLTDTSFHDAEISRLEADCEAQLLALKIKHESLSKQLADRRKKEGEVLAEQRRKEEEELMERRRREDEEREARFQREQQEREELLKEENRKREREREDRERGVIESAEIEMERLEQEMENRVDKGKRTLRELDEKRKVCSNLLFFLSPFPIKFC